MTATPLPELDLARIRRFCDDRVPARLQDRIRMEVEVPGRAVTIVETRAPWTPEIGPAWTRMPIARLRHHATDQTWSLWWCDRNLKWHHYDRIPPSAHIEPLLAEIKKDPNAIFWG